jgi:hypothetical protein
MAARYRIDVERGLICSAATGTLTDEDLREHQSTLRSDPDFRRTLDQVWDFRGVDRVDISNAAVRDLARSRSFDAGTKRAIGAPKDVAYGLARMFQILHDDAPEDLQIFRSLEEAEAWLGLGQVD